jgi:hypothetical protein
MPWTNTQKHVPTSVRKAALERDDHHCTATIQRTGDRCPEVTQLEAHELTRWYPGKVVTVDDLQILCAWHHNLITQQQAALGRKASPRAGSTRPQEKHPGLI